MARISDYFNTKPWFNGTKSMDEVTYSSLNSIEQQNVMIIKAWQEKNGFELG